MRDRLFIKLAQIISSKPWWSGLILLVFSILMTFMALQLELTTSFTNLLPQDDPMVDEFNTIIEEYDGASSLLVVATGNPEDLSAFAEAIVPQIEAFEQWVKRVEYKQPRQFIKEHGLMLMKSKDLENNKDLFLDPNLVEFLTNLNNSFEKEYIQSEKKISGQEQEQGVTRFLDGIQTWVTIFEDVLDGRVDNAGISASDAILLGDEYFRSWDRQMIILQVLPTFSMLEMEPSIESTNAIEEIVHNAGDAFGVRAGLTGSIPLSRDEMEAITSDSMTITTIALIGILILFIVAFRMFVSPVLAIITLILGVIWAMGIAWPLVKQLNMMTSMMAVILVGLGIDFSIHVISVYTEMRARGEDILTSMITTFNKSGAGIITGGLTTAVAFLTLLVAETEGLQEFGLVLGVGIVMTMLAALTVLPTLLVIRERILERFRKKSSTIQPQDISYVTMGKLANGLAKNWKIGLLAVVIFIGFLGYRGSQITMDYNYLNMEPVGLESIELQDRLIESFNISSDYALITARTLDEAHHLTDESKKMNTAGMVQSIVDYLPSDTEQESRRELVLTIRETMENASIDNSGEIDLDKLLKELIRLGDNVMEIQTMAVTGGQDKVYLKSALLVGVLPDEDDPSLAELNQDLQPVMEDMYSGLLVKLIDNAESKILPARSSITRFHQEFAKEFKSTVLSMANPERIGLEDLPIEIHDQYVSKSGDSYLISVFPKSNVWEINFLKRFSEELAEISPRATGLPPVFNALMDKIGEDGLLATQLAFAVIFILLLADFRSFKKAILAMFPLLIGVIWMLGIMEVTGLQITLLNIMAIPMIIGIGIDDGVHAVHRYQIEGMRAHNIVFASTGRAILLTSLTTMLGFGSLWFATYRGLGSMGIALFIGVGTCFLATVFIIPMLIGVFRKGQ